MYYAGYNPARLYGGLGMYMIVFGVFQLVSILLVLAFWFYFHRGGKMRAVIMKIGTMPLRAYFVKETKNIRGCELSTEQKIVFKTQEKYAIWQTGIIDKIEIDVPFVSMH